MKTIRLDGEIGWEITASWLSDAMAGESSVDLIINSGGGSIVEGFAIVNVMKDFQENGGTIQARVDLAASMASVIAMQADNVIMRSNSSLMMIHKAWTTTTGNSEDLRSVADTLEKLESMISEMYLERVSDNVSPEQLADMLAAETWLSGSEAVELGFADELADGENKNILNNVLTMVASTGRVDGLDMKKLVAKVKAMNSSDEQPLKNKILACSSLAEVEKTVRGAFGCSKAEVSAIVATVKKIVHSDYEQQENVDFAAISADIDKIFQKYT